jgi:hypothetical protein
MEKMSDEELLKERDELILKSFKRLKKLNSKEFFESFVRRINKIRELVDNFWEESQFFLKTIEEKYEAESFDELYEIYNEIHSDLYNDKELQDLLKLEKVFHLYHLKRYLVDFEAMINLETEELKNYSFELMKAFEMGRHVAYLDTTEITKNSNNVYLEAFDSIRGKMILEERRWAPQKTARDKELEEVIRTAEEYYRNGGRASHNTLAKWLKNHKDKYGDKFANIPDKILRKTVGGVAERYGCKLGVKKNTSQDEDLQ